MLPTQDNKAQRDDLTFDDGLTRAAPSAVGIDAGALEAFLDDVQAAGLELHGLMLHRDGEVAAEGWWWPYRAERPRIMHSVAKSFTACAIGQAVEEGLLRLDDKVISFFPEFLPDVVDEKLAAMTVEDLLTMRAGHAGETSGSLWRGIKTSWIAEFFRIPIVHQPGSAYVYTSAASYMLSAILTKVTGQRLHDYLKPRLFEPLGIVDEHWDIGPDGLNPGGNGLTCRLVDILKLGILHAQKGVWDGKRLLTEDWVEQATRAHGDAPYGYHWVVLEEGGYAAIGVFVQMVIVFPDHNATLAINAAMEESKQVRPLIAKHFPAVFRGAGTAAADARLKVRLADLATPLPVVSALSKLPKQISEVPFWAKPNPLGITLFRFDFQKDRCTFHLSDANGSYWVAAGLGGWIEGHTEMPGSDLHHGYDLKPARVVASARWLDQRTLEMTWIFVETAFRDTVIARFGESGDVLLDRSVNVNTAALNHPTIVGRR